jgi:hypothetical protein
VSHLLTVISIALFLFLNNLERWFCSHLTQFTLHVLWFVSICKLPVVTSQENMHASYHINRWPIQKLRIISYHAHHQIRTYMQAWDYLGCAYERWTSTVFGFTSLLIFLDMLIAFIVLCATSYLACSINVELLFSVLLVCQITFFTEFLFCIVIWLYVYFQLVKPSKTSVSCMVVTTQTHHWNNQSE